VESSKRVPTWSKSSASKFHGIIFFKPILIISPTDKNYLLRRFLSVPVFVGYASLILVIFVSFQDQSVTIGR